MRRTNLDKHIEQMTGEWRRAGTWEDPELGAAIDLMVTEAAEALDLKVRLTNPQFKRTHPTQGSGAQLRAELVKELGQVVIMVHKALVQIAPGYSLGDAVSSALWSMALDRELSPSKYRGQASPAQQGPDND